MQGSLVSEKLDFSLVIHAFAIHSLSVWIWTQVVNGLRVMLKKSKLMCIVPFVAYDGS